MKKKSLLNTNFFKKLKNNNEGEAQHSQTSKPQIKKQDSIEDSPNRRRNAGVKSSNNLEIRTIKLQLHSYKILPLRSSRHLNLIDLSRRFSFVKLDSERLAKLNLNEIKSAASDQKENKSLSEFSHAKDAQASNQLHHKHCEKKYLGAFFQRKLGKTFSFLKLGQSIQTEVYLSDVKKVLRKHNRSANEIEFLSEYLKLNKNIKSLIQPSEANIDQSSNKYRDELITKIAKGLAYEQSYNEQIVFKYGDKADKFFIIIKGKVSVLIPREEEVELSQTEFFYYLCMLSYFNEYELLKRCYELNYRNFANFPYSLDLFLPSHRKSITAPKIKNSIKSTGKLKLRIPDNEALKTFCSIMPSNNLSKNIALDQLTIEKNDSSKIPASAHKSPLNSTSTISKSLTKVNKGKVEFKLKQPNCDIKPILKREGDRKMSHYSISARIGLRKGSESEDDELIRQKKLHIKINSEGQTNTNDNGRKSLFGKSKLIIDHLEKNINEDPRIEKVIETPPSIEEAELVNPQAISATNLDLVMNFNRGSLTHDLSLLQKAETLMPAKKRPIMNSKCYILFKIYWINILQKLIYRTSVEEYISRLTIDPLVSIIDKYPFIEEFALSKIKPQIDVINKFRQRTKGSSFFSPSAKLNILSPTNDSIPFPHRDESSMTLSRKASGLITSNLINKKEQKSRVKIYRYYEVVTLTNGQKFGDVAFSLEKKRTGTIIATEDSDMAFLSKDNYLNLLKEFNDQIIKKNIQILLSSKLFTSLTSAFLKKKHIMNLFVIQLASRHQIIMKENSEVNQFYFIKSGNIELSINKSLFEIDTIIAKLGGRVNEYHVALQSNPKFVKYYQETKIKKKIFILQESEYVGLEDMTVPRKNEINTVEEFRNKLVQLDWPLIKYEKGDSELTIVDFINSISSEFESKN